MDFEKIVEKITGKMYNMKYEIAEMTFNDSDGVNYILMGDDGEIYEYYACSSNTIFYDVVLYTATKTDYFHDCYDCPFNDDKVQEMWEKYDLDNLNCRELKNLGEIPEDYNIMGDETMTIDEVRKECVVDQTAEEFWDQIESEVVENLWR